MHGRSDTPIQGNPETPARQRRSIKTAISERIFFESTKPENADRIRPSYPKIQVQSLDKAGTPRD